MNEEQFIEGVKIAVRDGTISSVLKVLNKPPGKHPKQEQVHLSEWYKSSSESDKSNIEKVITYTVNLCVFVLLAVLDGVSIIESGPEKGDLELYYVKGLIKELINQPNSEFLHDIFRNSLDEEA